MRKKFKFSATALALFFVIECAPIVERQLAARQPTVSSARRATRSYAPSWDETDSSFHEDSLIFREDRLIDDGLFANSNRRIKTTGAEESPRPLSDDLDFYDPEYSARCVNCFEFWEHRNAVWGEYLYWRPRGADVTYATPVDGTLATSVPVGPQAVAAFGYDSGFRVGGGWALDRCSSLTANYTWYQASTSDDIALPGGGSFLRAETVHPSTVNVAADSLAAQALYDLDLQSVDINYKSLLWYGNCHVVNYVIGLKYAQLEQQFDATYSILGTTTVNTNVDFKGIGPRFGLEGERSVGDHGLLFYSKGYVNFLFGSSSADYLQRNIFTGIQAQTALRDSRVVTVPELELGTGWQSCNGSVRITAGYYLAAWHNMMTTPEYLSTVRELPNSFERQIKTLTLDGLNVRAELRF